MSGAPARNFAAAAAAWMALACAAWKGLTWRQWAGAFFVGAAVFAWDRLAANPWGPPDDETHFALFSPRSSWLLSNEIAAVALLMAVAVADRAVDTSRASRRAYAIAVLTGVVCGVALGNAVAYPWIRWIELTVYSLCIWLMFGGLATFVYVDRKRARAAQTRLHAAELQRTKKARDVLESRLQSMQARVEPQFLFNTLAQVKRLYEIDPPLAGRMLDDLIAYLRAAMPRMRDTSSTVAQEIDLARAFLAIVKVRLGDRLEFAIDLPDAVGDARMPPMMLLPLIDHAVVHGLEPAQETGILHITTDVGGGRLRLTVTDSGAGFVPEAGGDSIDSIRERLMALFGGDASLTLSRGQDRGTQAVMEVPFERAVRQE